MQPRHGFRVPGNSAQNILARPVGNVFVQPQLGPFLFAQKLLVLGRQMKRQFAEKENLPALGQLAIGPRARFLLLGAQSSRRGTYSLPP